jgi:hypothetical protein
MAKKRRRKAVFPVVTLEWIRGINRLIPFRPSESITARSDKLAITILTKYFGRHWIEQHIDPATKTTFLKCDDSTATIREQQRMRRVVLAEMLFNLQNVNGFYSLLVKMLKGDVESTYGALEIARMLVTTAIDTGLSFRFVSESKIAKRDYDLSIRFSDGVKVRAETKCKMEETKITLRTVEESISTAKKQLPERAPGIVFIKVPRPWIEDETFAARMLSLGQRSIARSPWIVSIKFYTARIVSEEDGRGNGVTGEIVAFNEYTNDHHKFAKYRNRNWHMFPATGSAVPPTNMNYNGLPSTWQRLFVRTTEL